MSGKFSDGHVRRLAFSFVCVEVDTEELATHSTASSNIAPRSRGKAPGNTRTLEL